MNAYTQAATSGKYDVSSGLLGKYDHVRDYWEEEALRAALEPHLAARATAVRDGEGRGLRALDLGCGGGDGLAFLETLRHGEEDFAAADARLLHRHPLSAYKGVDLNDALLEQARERYGARRDVVFEKADLIEGLPVEPGEAGYDLYFASFGTFSHLDTAQTTRLLSEIAAHAPEGALVLCDWLGRYSYEWQNLWSAETNEDQWMDYRISYIYSPEERATRTIDSFPLRLVGRPEVEALLAAVKSETGRHFDAVQIADRSLFCGRHIDTGEYNGNPMPIRLHLNSLYDDSRRTDLDALRLTYRPQAGFDAQNRFFDELSAAWNRLLDFVQTLCTLPEDAPIPAAPLASSEAEREAAETMAHVFRNAPRFHGRDKRAMVIEPQLGYALRHLESALQQGQGCGHGLVGVFRVGAKA